MLKISQQLWDDANAEVITRCLPKGTVIVNINTHVFYMENSIALKLWHPKLPLLREDFTMVPYSLQMLWATCEPNAKPFIVAQRKGQYGGEYTVVFSPISGTFHRCFGCYVKVPKELFA